MVLIDNATITFRHDVDGDGTEEEGQFQISKNLEVEHQVRSQFVLNETADRLLGFLNPNTEENERQGITFDTGGGNSTYDISFTEPSGGVNNWGALEGGIYDGTGDSARRKQNVFMRFIQSGNYGSLNPVELRYGEYHDGGDYEDFIPCTIQDARVTVSAEGEETIEGRISLVEVATFSGQNRSSNARGDF